MAIIIKTYKGKQYYKIGPDEKIKENAIYKNTNVSSLPFNQIALNSAAIGRPSSEFRDHDLYNPVLIKVKNNIKPQKFDVENLYLSGKEINVTTA